MTSHIDNNSDNKCDGSEAEIRSDKKDVFAFLTKLINAIKDFFIRILDLLGIGA